MTQPSIVFVTHISYLDGAIEHIKQASERYTNFNVIITLTPNQIYKNIIDLRHIKLSDYKLVVDLNDIREPWKLGLLEPYFKNCKSVRFLLFQQEGIRTALSMTLKLNRLIRQVNPKFIHFDSYINRQIFQLPFLFMNRKKIILNVHDAKPHSGEEHKTSSFIEKILYKWCNKFVTFSNFSKNQLEVQLRPGKQVVNSFLLPFSFYRNYVNERAADNIKPMKISFVGRVSKYKGIELFIDGLNKVHETLPQTEFVIAGKSFGGYVPDYNKVKNPSKLSIIPKHLSNSELVEIILNSQLIVCPYLDASQSGVVMTAIALNRPVLVTDAGGLKEYINEGENGIICKIDQNDLAMKIIDFCSNNRYQKMFETMKSTEFGNQFKSRYIEVLTRYIYT